MGKSTSSTPAEAEDTGYAARAADGFCPTRDVVDRIGDKWSMLVLLMLGQQGRLRFTKLRRTIPDISQRMLAVTLRHLERDGLLVRTYYPQVPPKVEYELTLCGRSLLTPLHMLVDWAMEARGSVEAARSRYDRRRDDPVPWQTPQT